MASSKDSNTSKDAKPTDPLQDGDATEVFAPIADQTEPELEAPATGYVYVSQDASTEEIDEALAAESLTKQLLRNGDTFEKKPKGEQARAEKAQAKAEKAIAAEKAKPATVVPGTAIGMLKGSRANEPTSSGKPYLPTSSRTTEIGRESKKQDKKNKNLFPIVALSGGALALVAGGVAYALLGPGSQGQTPQVESIVSVEPTNSESASPTAAPVPSINNHVPEVKYVDPTETAVEPGSIEYIEESAAAEEPIPEETVAEEIPNEAPVEEAPIEQVPAEESAATEEPVATEEATTEVTETAEAEPTQDVVPTTEAAVEPTTDAPVETAPTVETAAPTQGSEATTQGEVADSVALQTAGAIATSAATGSLTR